MRKEKYRFLLMLLLAALVASVLTTAQAAKEAPSAPEVVAGSSLTIFGLPHTAMGAAQLDTIAGDTLIVSNIGSSGNDGVSIDLGTSHDAGHMMGFRLPAGNLNGFWNAALVGQIGGLPGGATVFSAHATITNDTVHVNIDFSPMGTTTRKLDIFNDGVLVFSNIAPQKSEGGALIDGFKYKLLPADMSYLGEYDDEGTYFP